MIGRLGDASNTTLLASVTLDGVDHLAVYKPVAGERPLWDFPGAALARREAAAYVVSRAAGWDVVPPTVFREDGPFGPGSLQWWLDAGDDEDGDPLMAEPGAGLIDLVPPGRLPSGWHSVLAARDVRGETVLLAHADDGVLRAMALFDAVTNNADRKGGHVLAGAMQPPGGARVPGEAVVVRGVDHGLTFHPDPKLRTVLWGWAGRRFTAAEADALDGLAAGLGDDADPGGLCAALADLIDADDVRALRRRIDQLRRSARFPRPTPGMPPIPWPAF